MVTARNEALFELSFSLVTLSMMTIDDEQDHWSMVLGVFKANGMTDLSSLGLAIPQALLAEWTDDDVERLEVGDICAIYWQRWPTFHSKFG